MSAVRESWDRYAAAWATRYGGYDLRRAPVTVRRWQRLAYRIGTAMVRVRMPAGAFALLGTALAVAVPVLTVRGGTWSLVAAGLVLAGALAGAVEAAMTVLRGRASGGAAVREAVVARLAEVSWLASFWVTGVAGLLVVAAGLVTGLHEYVRAYAIIGGMSRLAVHTAGDRPTRVVVAVVGLALAGLGGTGLAAGLLTVAVAVWLALGVLGLGQLAGTLRRSLR